MLTRFRDNKRHIYCAGSSACIKAICLTRATLSGDQSRSHLQHNCHQSCKPGLKSLTCGSEQVGQPVPVAAAKDACTAGWFSTGTGAPIMRLDV